MNTFMHNPTLLNLESILAALRYLIDISTVRRFRAELHCSFVPKPVKCIAVTHRKIFRYADFYSVKADEICAVK